MTCSPHGRFEGEPIADMPIRLPGSFQDASDADLVSPPDGSMEGRPEIETETEQPAPRPELAFDVVLPPNIGEGRFVPQKAIVYKKDGEGHPVLVDGRPVIESVTYLHPHLDFSRPPTHDFFASLREFSPFHARSLLSEVHFSTSDAPKAGGVPLPRQVRLHNHLFTFDRHLGGGGIGEIVLYRDEQNRPIVMKLLSRLGRGAQGMIRALEEASVHALVRPVALEEGESPSLLSKAMRMTDVTRLSTIARDLYPEDVWRAMDAQERERAGEELRDLAVGFVDAVTLVPDGKVENSLVCAFLPYEDQGDLLDTMGQQFDALRSSADLSRVQFQELRREMFPGRVEDALRMAQSLLLVHTLGVTHRDVKPENFFRGADGQLRLADFGLAKKEAVRTLRGLDRALKHIHEQLGNDAEGLYLLAMGAQEKTGALTDEQAVQVWNWLRDFVAYQSDPELSVNERLALMKDLISRLAFHEGSLDFLSEQGAGAWKPSLWNREELEQVEGFMQSEPSIADEESAHSVSSDSLTDELLAEESSPTLAGSLMGSPKYTAPEAVRGESGKRRRGPKEDVFAFGVILHVMFSMGRVRGGSNLRILIDERAWKPDAGIEFSEGILSQEERAQVIDSVAQQKSATNASLTYEQQRMMEIRALIAMPGLPRMVGLAKWCTMSQSEDRPTDKEVIEVLTLARAEERAQERASA